MEFAGILNHIDNDENIGESWIEGIIRSFNFPDSPLLFHHFRHLNKRIGYLREQEGVLDPQYNEQCHGSIPSINDFWSWTKYFPIDKTRVIILDNHDEERGKNVISSQILSHWGKQGVLVIKSHVSLQCKDNEEHTSFRSITNHLIEYMANNCSPQLLFIIIGDSSDYKYLQQDKRRIINLPRWMDDDDEGTSVFRLCNEILEQFHQEPIQWKITSSDHDI